MLIPYPGTAIYDQAHQVLGCTEWWLDRHRVDCLSVPQQGEDGAGPTTVDEIIALHQAIEEGTLAAGLVPYGEDVLGTMRQCLAYRREHNRHRWAAGAQAPVPSP